MPLPLQKPGATDAIVQAYGLKGYASLRGMDDQLYPMAMAEDLTLSPYDQLSKRLGMSRTGSAVVGNLLMLGVVPAADTVLQLLAIGIANPNAAAYRFLIERTTYASYTNLVGSNALRLRLHDGSAALPADTAALIVEGYRAAITGSPMERFYLAANSHLVYTLPDGGLFMRYRTTDPYRPSVAIFCEDSNVGFRLTAWCREWPLPG